MDDSSNSTGIDLLDEVLGEHEIYTDVYRIPHNINPEKYDKYIDCVETHNHPVDFIY